MKMKEKFNDLMTDAKGKALLVAIHGIASCIAGWGVWHLPIRRDIREFILVLLLVGLLGFILFIHLYEPRKDLYDEKE